MGNLLIPPSLLQSFECVPVEAHAAVLLRHAHRPSFLPSSSGYGHEVDLSPEGIQAAEVLGTVFRKRLPGLLLTSPMRRCVTTLKTLARGASWKVPLVEEARLANPGCFVRQADVAVPLSLQLGIFELVHRQLCQQTPLPGMRSTAEGVVLLLDLFTSHQCEPRALDVFVTHDATLAPTVGHLLGLSFNATNWPDFLEGIFFWRSSMGGLVAAWRGECYELLGFS